MKNMSQHTEWLSMIEVSGPFLAVSVLERIFPQGLDSMETYRKNRIRSAYEEWRDAVEEDDPQLSELHKAWIELVLKELLEFDDTVLQRIKVDSDLHFQSPNGDGQFTPDYVLSSDIKEKPMLFVSILPEGTDLEKVKVGDGWPIPIFERMTLFCRDKGVRLGIITNGERWMLVNAPIGSTSSHISWYARLWFQEPFTFKAFPSLLGVRRWFGPEEETLSAMLDESLKHHEEVTDTLGEQVKRAVEVLVQCLDKADQDRNRELLIDVPPTELYEAGLTVMMRLVFVLCAEERGLLLLGDSIYDQYYAITTLRGQLAEEADQHGHEVLERRHDAWARLLAVFRAVFGGIKHEALRMPALGGSLFDPDRFPFLEGRAKGTHWDKTPAQTLPIDNRTVLLLLDALQVLEQSGGALMLSYKALDVEQIGHVYEGLLEYTVRRLAKVTLGLIGSKKAKNPNLTLDELESSQIEGSLTLNSILESSTQRSISAINKSLEQEVDDNTFAKVIAACGGDIILAKRIKPFTHLLRTDVWGDYIVYRANSFAVTLGADRRETGTHYTPKFLTESIVETSLTPVVYIGPSEGIAPDKWQLKTSVELLELKICDPAMGSGAFLVQVCRWLSERLVEAWSKEEEQSKFITVDGLCLDEAGGADPMPDSLDERLVIARRLVAEKCLYGVDLNPMAVELAKLSIWLITMAKGRPFGFLDHNLRSGDSLLGLHNLEQLTTFSLQPKKKHRQTKTVEPIIRQVVADVLSIRIKLREIPIRDITDVQFMERLDRQAHQKLECIQNIADAIIGAALSFGGNERVLETILDNLSMQAAAYINGDMQAGKNIIVEAKISLSIDLQEGKPPRKPFHWALEFPEVFEYGGFNCVLGNPPFIGGRKISSMQGHNYLAYIKLTQFDGMKGTIDYVLYFLSRGCSLIKNYGTLGVITTDSITEGDNREKALSRIMNTYTIYNARSSHPWPGTAGVLICHIHIYKSTWKGLVKLDGREVKRISNLLEEDFGLSDPKSLISNKFYCSDGIKVQGIGFVLSEDEALNMIEKDAINNEVVVKYIIGDNLNSDPYYLGNRFVINFWNRSLEESSKYEMPWNVIVQRVKPYREKLTKQVHEGCFWKFWDRREQFFNKVKKLESMLVCSKLSKYLSIVVGDSKNIYSEDVKVFKLHSYASFSVLQSSIHSIWHLTFGSTRGETPRYVGSRCFDPFPFPYSFEELERKYPTNKNILLLNNIGQEFYSYRQDIMVKSHKGLTLVYNRFHYPKESSVVYQKLRELQILMDQAVTVAYGWNDLVLGHGFYETQQGIRFTISEDARHEVLKRLLKLNNERYAIEVAQGLHDNKKMQAMTSKKRISTEGTLKLF